MKKRLFFIILALLMLMALLPVTAFSATSGYDVTITLKGDTKTYDGTPLYPVVKSVSLPENFTYELVLESATHVADSPVTAGVKDYVIYNADHEDVTDLCNVIVIHNSEQLTITPAPLTVVTQSNEKVYDGKALTADGSVSGFVNNNENADFRITGTQTEVGSSSNTYTLAFTGTAAETDYYVDKTLSSIGTLTVNEYQGLLTFRTLSDTKTYDGTPLYGTIETPELPEGYYVDTCATDAHVTSVDEGSMLVHIDHLIIRNSDGNDITDNLNVDLDESGTIQIIPAPLIVTTGSAEKEYDGNALTAEGSVTGFTNNETASFAVTGSQTEIGSSTNTYTLVFDGTAKEINYTVGTENLGTLTVNPISYPITYDLAGGTADGNPETYTIETEDFTLANPTREGYTFTGWSGTDLDGTKNKTVTIQKGSTGARSYAANWQAVETWEEKAPDVPATPDKPVDTDNPNTGDNSCMLLWVMTLVLSGVAFIGTAIYGRKKKEN